MKTKRKSSLAGERRRGKVNLTATAIGRVVLYQTKAWYLPWHNTRFDVSQGRLENSFYHFVEVLKEAEARLDLI